MTTGITPNTVQQKFASTPFTILFTDHCFSLRVYFNVAPFFPAIFFQQNALLRRSFLCDSSPTFMTVVAADLNRGRAKIRWPCIGGTLFLFSSLQLSSLPNADRNVSATLNVYDAFAKNYLLFSVFLAHTFSVPLWLLLSLLGLNQLNDADHNFPWACS